MTTVNNTPGVATSDQLSDLPPQQRSLNRRLVETVRHYWDLGFISFGGPGVHVVILRKRFVGNLGWLDATTFQDLFSLGKSPEVS